MQVRAFFFTDRFGIICLIRYDKYGKSDGEGGDRLSVRVGN